MKTKILWLMLSYFLILFFLGISLAEDLESVCYEEYDRCTAFCDKIHSKSTVDIWGRCRDENSYGQCVESTVTRQRKDKCKNNCVISRKGCIKRKRSLEDEQNTEEGLQIQIEETQEDTAIEYPSSTSDSNIYTWTDKNGVVHITNDKDSIPPEYREQIEKGTNKEATEIIKDKNDTKSKSTDKKTKSE